MLISPYIEGIPITVLGLNQKAPTVLLEPQSAFET